MIIPLESTYPAGTNYVSELTAFILSTPPYMTGVCLAGMLAYLTWGGPEHCFVSTQNHCHMDL